MLVQMIGIDKHQQFLIRQVVATTLESIFVTGAHFSLNFRKLVEVEGLLDQGREVLGYYLVLMLLDNELACQDLGEHGPYPRIETKYSFDPWFPKCCVDGAHPSEGVPAHSQPRGVHESIRTESKSFL